MNGITLDQSKKGKGVLSKLIDIVVAQNKNRQAERYSGRKYIIHTSANNESLEASRMITRQSEYACSHACDE